MRETFHATALLIIGALMVVSLRGVQITSGLDTSSTISTGPHVDEVVFHVIANQDQRVLALLYGEIEMDNSYFDPVFLPTMNEDPDISVFEAVRNGYGHITINCDKYPLNISGLRRAFAFAFNKTAVTQLTMDGFSVEHDSLVPLPNGWCVEDQFDWHYYTAQPEIGNQILDDLNFTIDQETGYRLTPSGSPFEIEIEYAVPGCCCCYSIPQAAVDALHSLHINAKETGADFNEYITRLDNHGDYDMVFYAINFYDNDVDWLAYEYWSEYADVEFQNPTNFKNATYDSWREQLLYGTTYEEIYEAASEMQKILHYNVPRLVVYENLYQQAYRNDVFTGHIEDLRRYIAGPWTLRNMYRLDGMPGGSVPVAISQDPDSFNIFVSESSFSKTISDNLWPSLFRYGPDVNPWPDLAENMITETHSDNPDVAEGHVRFTIDIIRNATWSDGEPITAQDVAFSITYVLESAIYGNPAVTDVGPLIGAYATTPYRVIIEFNTESYWHFSNFAFDYIIPEHIFNDETGIGYEGWSTWNPVSDPEEPYVNCGPFIFSDYEAGEYYTIEKNENFYYYAGPEPPDPTSTTSISTGPVISNTTTQSIQQEMNWPAVLSAAIGSGSLIVMIFCLVIIINERKKLVDI